MVTLLGITDWTETEVNKFDPEADPCGTTTNTF